VRVVFEGSTMRESIDESGEHEFRSWGSEDSCEVDGEDTRMVETLANGRPEFGSEERGGNLSSSEL
jgi:hypothetical protein